VGSTTSICSIGFFVGSVAIATYGMTRRPLRTSLLATFIQGLVLFTPVSSTVHIAVCGFLFLFLAPIFAAAHNLIISSCVEANVLGRVTATTDAIGTFAASAAMFVAGPIVDDVMQPLLESPSAPLADTFLGTIYGTGKGKGIALLWASVGTVQCTVALLFITSSQLRKLEKTTIIRTSK
jgi:DHA3 family multidrug efflux protein-like MFS transporter